MTETHRDAVTITFQVDRDAPVDLPALFADSQATLAKSGTAYSHMEVVRHAPLPQFYAAMKTKRQLDAEAAAAGH